MRLCRACGLPDHGLDRCEVAARKTPGGDVNALSVNRTEPPTAVNRAETPAVNQTSARGTYPNTESRREYMRKYMRDRRSGSSKGA